MRFRASSFFLAAAAALMVRALHLAGEEPAPPLSSTHVAEGRAARAFVDRHCIDCHGSIEAKGNLDLQALANEPIERRSAEWETVVRRLLTRQMPPAGTPKPTESEYESALSALTQALDDQAAERPRPGRTASLRRLTRTEYANAVRDLLAMEIDAAALVPPDEAGHGFDNVNVSELSPTRMERYVDAAQKISRLAVGGESSAPSGETFRVPADVTQEEHVEGLPIGTRGGLLVPYTFPRDGDYEIQIRLTRDRDEHVEGLHEPHELEVLLDRDRVAGFTVKPPKNETDHQHVDRNLHARISVSAGPHDLGVTFVKNPSRLLETKRQPYQARFNLHRHPRTSPAIFEVSIVGPYDDRGPGKTPSRDRLFVRYPTGPEEEEACAKRILSTLTRRAYRRPTTEVDLERPLALYREARRDGDFDAGIEAGVAAVLVNPNFLFRIEVEPEAATSGEAYRVSDLDLASRLSFFLWSSIPDDELLAAAERGELSQPKILEAQVRRMLADPRSKSLATNFAAQWLHLRNLDSAAPDGRSFPDFDQNLREALRIETESLFDAMVREDRGVLYLLDPGETFLNERLSKHYGVPHVYGSRFRRVALEPDSKQGGLLRQGSVLTVTSYATRTSPTIRGKWILENLLGTPPSPPPANIPALEDVTVDASLSVRDRLAQHRADAACASCHDLVDPPGLALENFDAVGRWRAEEEGAAIDASGGLADGSEFVGVEGLEKALLARPEPFVTTLAEKLLTYALGRGVTPDDGPAVRRIVREAAADDYRFSTLVLEIAKSVPFQMRRAE
jgi:mono/diheme cytochrome c family protein